MLLLCYRYAAGQEIDPGLAGQWNTRPNTRFISSPPVPGGEYKYGIAVVGDPRDGYDDPLQILRGQIEAEARGRGLRFTCGGRPLPCSSTHASIEENLRKMKSHGVHFVLCVLCDNSYDLLKYVADMNAVVTQCVKWEKVRREPKKGYCSNLLLKIHTKIGGTNHTLCPVPGTAPPTTKVYQDPPASLCWVFDKPCMVVGIDVSHAEPGTDRPSVAAVVGSMNGQVMCL